VSANAWKNFAQWRRRQARPRWQVWLTRIALATALAVVLAYFPYRLLDGAGARKAEGLRVQHQRTMEASRQLAAENERLRHEIDALKSDVRAIEDIARDELGLVRPGEIIIRIEEEP
jgi:cell division protein FtsB